MELLALLFLWIFFSHVIAAVIPALFAGIGYCIGFLFLCIGLVLKAAFIILWWSLWLGGTGVAFGARAGAHGAYTGAIFLFYLAQEWRRGAPEDEPEEFSDDADEFDGDDADPQDGEAEPRDPYTEALARFSLLPGFTAADLNRAYKRLIRRAHPDAGGSLAEAQAVNAGRDLIARRHGWQ